MKISNVFRTYHEAAMFRYLASLSYVDQMTVQICRLLLDSLMSQPWTTLQRLGKTLHQQMAGVKFTDVERVLQDLLTRKVLMKKGSRIMFRIRLAENPTASVLDQSSGSARSNVQSASASAIHSDQSSASSDQARSKTSSSGNQWVANHLDDQQSSNLGIQSPLGSYFDSVNSTLNDDYMKDSLHSQSSHGDHLVNRNSLDWLDSSSASSSIQHSEKSSKQDNHLDFATKPISNESSEVSSSNSSSQSQSSSSESSQRDVSATAVHHSAGQQFRSIATSLFKRVSFMSLMSHPVKVRQIAEAEFNLVVASRKYEGIRQADSLFKYEFKMNYQKFGKIGNRINNMLMKDISDHNN